jgi:EAL domain-containing protein (putative c-di-GMP-specific phosphodiesterase class I)
MRDQEATIETLHVLRGLGVRLALDDFGTGYSSLSHLREFPIDILKITKPFVEDLGAGTSDPAFLEAILGLARALDLTVIVEGIETADQAETLHRLGCRIGQGYHFARPLDRRRPPGRALAGRGLSTAAFRLHLPARLALSYRRRVVQTGDRRS